MTEFTFATLNSVSDLLLLLLIDQFTISLYKYYAIN